MHILILNGPNLNMLGDRESEQYGTITYDSLCEYVSNYAHKHNVKLTIEQTNSESDLIDLIHGSKKYDGLIINPAAFTHTSVAIRDALACVKLPKIEVHLSNVHARESFRHHSYSAASCIGQVSGFGKNSYLMAINYLVELYES